MIGYFEMLPKRQKTDQSKTELIIIRDRQDVETSNFCKMWENAFGFKKTSTKIMYLSYCTLGGIIKSPFVAPSLKYIWVFLNVAAFLLMHCFIIDYTILALSGTNGFPFDIVIALHALLSILGAYTTFFTHLVTFRFRQNLEKIMSFLDDEPAIFADISDLESAENAEGLYRIRDGIKYQLFSTFLSALYFVIRPTRVLLYGRNIQTLRNVYSYFYCSRFIYGVSSFNEYVVIYSLQLTTVALLFLPLLTLSIFNSFVVFELHNKFVKLRTVIGRYTESHRRSVERIYRLRLSTRGNDTLRSSQGRLASQIQMQAANVQFNMGMVKCIRCHQRLVASTRFFKTYVEIFFSLFLPFVTIIIITEGILLRTGGEEKSTFLDFSILLVEVATGVFKYCHMGMLLEQMNEIIADEIYNTTWFQMPPSQRKLIQVFLGQAQKPIHFFALKVFPMLRPTFPAMLRSAFSIVQVVSKIRH